MARTWHFICTCGTWTWEIVDDRGETVRHSERFHRRYTECLMDALNAGYEHDEPTEHLFYDTPGIG